MTARPGKARRRDSQTKDGSMTPISVPVPVENPLATQFRAARKVGAPLVVIRTADPAASMVTLNDVLQANGGKASQAFGNVPALKWDHVNGMLAINATGAASLDAMLSLPLEKGQAKPDKLDQAQTVDAHEALALMVRATPRTAIFMLNAHRAWTRPGPDGAKVVQAIWNLRDPFKSNFRTLILFTPAGAPIPTELAADVFVLDEPLPTKDQLADVVRSIYASVDQAAPEKDVARAVDALAGARSNFIAEQATAISMTKSGVNVDALWEQKRQMVNDTPGLTYIEPRLTFEDLGGVNQLKQFLTLLFKGAAAPTVIVMLDEIDDMFAGVGSDSSGVSTVLHGKFLSSITKTGAKGALFMGHPGVGKSAILEAAAHEFGVPLIGLDFGDVKNALVGASEERATTALNVIDAISFGHALYIGTCNSVGNLSPQLQRRFPWRFFFDLPTAEEKKMIWPVYINHPHPEADGPLTAAQVKELPDDTNFTGAEIKETCENAWRFNCTLKEAVQYVVPIAVSMPEAIDERRKFAANRYLSAAYPGPYRLKGEAAKGVTSEPVAYAVIGKLPRAISDMRES
jgi:ATPase family protein associated with various cellular activities (AAA)